MTLIFFIVFFLIIIFYLIKLFSIEKWLNIYPDTEPQEELEFERENSVRCPGCLPSCSYVAYSISTDYASLIETTASNDLL